MGLQYPDTFAEHTTPLPLDKMGTRAADAAAELALHGFEVHTGLTPEHAKSMSLIAQQPSIREYCPNDSTNQFATPESTDAWLREGDETLHMYGRGVFLLLHWGDADTAQLAGYGWTGPEASDRVPGGQVTFAVRMNEAFQGNRAARPFTTLILAGSAALYGAKSVWLEAWGSNTRATRTYEDAGFLHHPDASEFAVRPSVKHGPQVPDVRLFMSVPDELLNR